MRLWTFLRVLVMMKLFSPPRLMRLFFALRKDGMNILALLRVNADMYGDKTALCDARGKISYKQLAAEIEQLTAIWQEQYQLGPAQRVGLICKSHASLVRATFSLTSAGAAVYLLNPDMSVNQLKELLKQKNFDLLIADKNWSVMSSSDKIVLSYEHTHLPSIEQFLKTKTENKRRRTKTVMGKVVLLTGGTTGTPKEAGHQPSLFNYVQPFLALLTKVKLHRYDRTYIATPLYHGYGVAVLFMGIILGKTIFIRESFQTKQACNLIRQHHIEVITVVPLMLQKMLEEDAASLQSLACIVSGGARLHGELAKEALQKLGPVLYNLYGTSEAGLNTIATPADLMANPQTIGKPVGGRFKIVNPAGKPVTEGEPGQFCVKQSWSQKTGNEVWIETGDIGYRDPKGFYFLCGRTDEMIVSAGINVYPVELEQVLMQHPLVKDVAVIGIDDVLFGQRLKAFIQPERKKSLDQEKLMVWLRAKVAKHQIPKEVEIIEQLPYTAVGKLDKKILK
ncbi:AMP-binding protein [Halalkalibacter oceani]|uniref:AMP-binding protein n=1 Tax=Halalkalibacter oceani TaxID=1653776 RepID=UPI003398FD5C